MLPESTSLSAMHRIFLLSPARVGGERTKQLLRNVESILAGEAGKRSKSLAGAMLKRSLADAIAEGEASLGEVFTFLSALYFRGKLAYAKTFASPPAGAGGALVITSSHGLLDADTPADAGLLQAFAEVPIDLKDSRYRATLEGSARALRSRVGESCSVVLLGSIATGKYADILIEVFGERLLFPIDFVGRGDMSRGGLMLRCAADGVELPYVPVLGAARRGKRPAKLEPLRAKRSET